MYLMISFLQLPCFAEQLVPKWRSQSFIDKVGPEFLRIFNLKISFEEHGMCYLHQMQCVCNFSGN